MLYFGKGNCCDLYCCFYNKQAWLKTMGNEFKLVFLLDMLTFWVNWAPDTLFLDYSLLFRLFEHNDFCQKLHDLWYPWTCGLNINFSRFKNPLQKEVFNLLLWAVSFFQNLFLPSQFPMTVNSPPVPLWRPRRSLLWNS